MPSAVVRSSEHWPAKVYVAQLVATFGFIVLSGKEEKRVFFFFYDFLFPLLLHNTFLFNLLICIFSWLLYSLMARSVVSFSNIAE